MDIKITPEEKQVIESMSLYWDEVYNREDKSPLGNEIKQAINVLGKERVLKIISGYIKNYKIK